MGILLRDIRYGARALLNDRSFAVTVILTLAVCIAANTTTFAIVNSVLLRPLPVPDPDALVMMSNRYPKAGAADSTNSSGADYYDRLREVTAFEEQAMFSFPNQTVEINGVPQQVVSMAATASLFRLLRVAPSAGRAFTDEEGEIGAEQKVILSHGLSQELYGNGVAVGRELRISGRPFTVVGVMGTGFGFVNPEVRLWIPLAFNDQQKTGHHSNNWFNIGRLKPGATLAQARAQIEALNARNMERFPQWKQVLMDAGFYTAVEPLQETLVGKARGVLYLLWGGALFVLLIGVLNVANLSLVRYTLRRKDVATRMALGAGRGQIIRRFVVENALLTLVGGLAGIAMGAVLLKVLPYIGGDRLPRANEIGMDIRVVVAAVAMALLIGAVVGCAPLAQAFKVNLNSVLHEQGRGGTAQKGARRIPGQALVIAQVGFAFVLLAGAGLLLVSFRQVLMVDPGFKSEGLVTASIHVTRAKYPGDNDIRILLSRALDSVRRVPGVTAAGATSSIPFGNNNSDSVILAEHYVMKPGESVISPRQVIVTEGYFEAMKISLVRGRYFDRRDNETAPDTVIVDERLANRFWAGKDPIGQRMYQPTSPSDVLKVDANTRWRTVVGVVRSIKHRDLAGTDSPVGAYYFPAPQDLRRGYTFAVRTGADTSVAFKAIRAAITAVDPELALFDVHTMVEREELSVASRKTSMTLALGFGGVALFLSAVGIYGILAYNVTQRWREIGIRVALGSTGRGIVKLVLREGLLLAATGSVIGLIGAGALRGVIGNELYGVRPFDPGVMFGVIAVLGIVALAASFFPAYRAVRVDPVRVLNQQ